MSIRLSVLALASKMSILTRADYSVRDGFRRCLFPIHISVLDCHLQLSTIIIQPISRLPKPTRPENISQHVA